MKGKQMQVVSNDSITLQEPLRDKGKDAGERPGQEEEAGKGKK